MNRNRKVKVKKNLNAYAAVGMAAVMGVTTLGASPVLAAEESDTENSKEETVYVNADANGKVSTITVSDHLVNNEKSDSISDASDLKDIENVKGDETFSGTGNDMTWAADGNDIYYQGTSDKKLPVDVSFTYYLDGKEIAPEDLAGQSGKVTIKIQYKNNLENGKDTTPFAMMTGLILPEDKFSNVSVDNGRIIDDGSRSVVLAFGFPGLSDVLDLDTLKQKAGDAGVDDADDFEITDTVEITADVTDFSLDSTYTVALSGAFDDIDFSGFGSLDEVRSSLSDLEDATEQLVEGGSELAEGTSQLSSSYGEMDSGISELQSGIDTAASGVSSYTNGVSQVNSGAQTLASGTSSAASGAQTLANGINTYTAGVGEVAAGVTTLKNGAQQTADGAGTLSSKVGEYADGVASAYEGAKQLKEPSSLIPE